MLWCIEVKRQDGPWTTSVRVYIVESEDEELAKGVALEAAKAADSSKKAWEVTDCKPMVLQGGFGIFEAFKGLFDG